ncbi:hypothetical protein LguiA_025569 [Lonicera macranthoides]
MPHNFLNQLTLDSRNVNQQQYKWVQNSLCHCQVCKESTFNLICHQPPSSESESLAL